MNKWTMRFGSIVKTKDRNNSLKFLGGYKKIQIFSREMKDRKLFMSHQKGVNCKKIEKIVLKKCHAIFKKSNFGTLCKME